jgi:hypothetical protein
MFMNISIASATEYWYFRTRWSGKDYLIQVDYLPLSITHDDESKLLT